MPCDNLAVQRLKLNADVPAEILANAQAREALRLKLEQAAGAGSQVVAQVYPLNNPSPTYTSFRVRTRDGRTAELCVYTEAGYHGGGRTRTGAVQVQGESRALVRLLSEAGEPFATLLAEKLVSQKARARIKAAHRGVRETRSPNGTVIQRLTI